MRDDGFGPNAEREMQAICNRLTVEDLARLREQAKRLEKLSDALRQNLETAMDAFYLRERELMPAVAHFPEKKFRRMLWPSTLPKKWNDDYVFLHERRKADAK
jgi:hypothetical protein